jgi:hypothetical protein
MSASVSSHRWTFPHLPQIDAHYDKLRNIGEYIEDTEEYINIELDAGRNRLIRLDIVLTAATFALAPFNLMAGALLVVSVSGSTCSASMTRMPT